MNFRYIEKDLTPCVTDSTVCNSYRLPRTYNAYHLNGQQINIDGRLDDAAWQEVPWTENFVDMRSEVYPDPYLETKVKIRYMVFMKIRKQIICEILITIIIMIKKEKEKEKKT